MANVPDEGATPREVRGYGLTWSHQKPVNRPPLRTALWHLWWLVTHRA